MKLRIGSMIFILSLLIAGCSGNNADTSSEKNNTSQTSQSNNKKTDNSTEDNVKVKRFLNDKEFSGNLYVVSSSKGNILIDPGYYDKEVKDYIDSVGGIDAVLLTHGHWDHMNGLDELKSDFSKAPVYLPEKDKDFLDDPHLNQSEDMDFSLKVKSDVNLIKEGEQKIGGYNIKTIHTPGHTQGSVIYELNEENILFTGDTVLGDQLSTTYRPTGSDKDMQDSLQEFLDMSFNKDTQFYYGHGESSNYEILMEKNKELKEIKDK
ncbi:MBL fold metallo-hydrolase [Staphylococcus equorum]|uniref:MBL fold metallo-hydrolase n=1 Tax=Staphylococcus equorum TaxID=246432 RepID=UPI003D8069A5